MPRRRDRTTGPELVDVAIEDPEDAADAGWARGRDRGGRRLRPAHRWLLLGLGGVAVVVLAVVWVTADAAQQREEAGRRAALADVPGVLDSLDEPLRVLWSSQESMYPIAYSDQVVVVASTDDDVSVLALDATSGEVLWRREGVRDESCEALVAGSAWDAVRATEVICWVSTDIVQAEGPLGLPPSDVVVLDVATGAEVGAYEVPGTLIAVEALDGSALIASADAAGAVGVERWDPGGGVLWSVTEPGLLAQIQDEGLVFTVAGTHFWCGGLDAEARSLATGEPVGGVGARPEPFYSGTAQLADGGWASWALRDGPGGSLDRIWTRVTDGDGTLRFEVGGRPWVDYRRSVASRAGSVVSDGLPAGLLLMRLDAGIGDSGHVAALDARTGAVRWEGQRLAEVYPCVQVGGVLVAAGTGRVYAFDLATGRELWRGAAAEQAGGVSLTDGERLVLPTEVGDGPALTSFDIDTGATGWTVVLPEEPVSLRALGGRLVLMVTAGTEASDGYTVSVLG